MVHLSHPYMTTGKTTALSRWTFVGLKLNIQKTKIMASGPITLWQIDGETMEIVTGFYFFEAPKSLRMVTAAMKLKDAYCLEGKL